MIMLIIKKLAKQIREELHDAEKYARGAHELRTDYPAVAAVYAKLAEQELDHAGMLHEQVVKLIDKASAEKPVPPVMTELWKWQHDEMVEEEKEVRLLLDMYRR